MLPTLTSASRPWSTRPTKIRRWRLTFADLKPSQGDEADLDGTVDAFVVKSVSPRGTLKIGDQCRSPLLPGRLGVNDTIDATNHAYWTPVAGRDNGTLKTPSRWWPRIIWVPNRRVTSRRRCRSPRSTMHSHPDQLRGRGRYDETKTRRWRLTFADLKPRRVTRRTLDGTVDAFVVKSRSPAGTLKIGDQCRSPLLPGRLGVNDTIDATNHAYWTPVAGRDNGTLKTPSRWWPRIIWVPNRRPISRRKSM